MELPALISKKFAFAKAAKTDLELYDLLLKNTELLVRFFVYASEDETWSQNHEEFFNHSLTWFTQQFLLGRLDESYAKEIAEAYYEHYSTLHSTLPYNIKVKICSQIYPMNSLLLGVQSEYLKTFIARDVREGRKKLLALPIVDEKNVAFILDYLERSDLRNLWKQEKADILTLLELANRLHLDPLAKECQSILKRYVSLENVLDTLIQAHHKQWLIVQEACVEYCNCLNSGYLLQTVDQDHLGFEFVIFSDKALEAFEKLKSCITHLIVSKNLPMQESFADVLKQAVKIVSLNLSGSEEMSPYLDQVPEKVKEVLLARCIWLNDKTFKVVSLLFPQINKISISQNTDITYAALGELKKFLELKSLELSSCHQIGDNELSLILHSCLNLREIDLSGCRNITARGFIELAQILSRLTYINAAKTSINDNGLIALANRSHFLEKVNFHHCQEITERGLEYLLKYASNLKEVNLSKTKISEEALLEFIKNRKDVIFLL